MPLIRVLRNVLLTADANVALTKWIVLPLEDEITIATHELDLAHAMLIQVVDAAPNLTCRTLSASMST